VNSEDQFEDVPDTLLLEFGSPTETPILYRELGDDWLDKEGIPSPMRQRPLRVAIEKKWSQAGNPFFSFEQTSLPLPDGLMTRLWLDNEEIPFGAVGKSKRRGNPQRSASFERELGGIAYDFTAFLTEGRSGYYVKLHGNKRPGGRSKTTAVKRDWGHFV